MRKIARISALALSLGPAACSNPKAAVAGAGDAGGIGGLSGDQASQVLARVGDHTISAGDYVAALQHMDQFDRLRYSAPARRRELLDEMIDVVLLADEAHEKGYDRDPATSQEVREILRDAILRRAREGAPAPKDIPDTEVSAYFESHKSDFRDPERRRVSAIILPGREAAEVLLATAVKAPAAQWGELVRSKSVDPHAKADVPPELAGDLGFISPPGDARGTNLRVPDAVRAAAFEIGSPSEVLNRVVPAAGAFYIVKLQSKTDAHDRTLQDVEKTIRVELSQRKARGLEDAFLDELRKQYPIEIDEAALAQVKAQVPSVDAGAL